MNTSQYLLYTGIDRVLSLLCVSVNGKPLSRTLSEDAVLFFELPMRWSCIGDRKIMSDLSTYKILLQYYHLF